MWVVGRPMAIQMEQHHGWCQPQLLWWLCRPQLEWQPWYEGGTDSWNGNCSADLGKENKKISNFFETCQSFQIQLDFIRSCGCILHSHVSEYLILLNSEYYLNYNKLIERLLIFLCWVVNLSICKTPTEDVWFPNWELVLWGLIKSREELRSGGLMHLLPEKWGKRWTPTHKCAGSTRTIAWEGTVSLLLCVF